jgi:hypothetical protein
LPSNKLTISTVAPIPRVDVRSMPDQEFNHSTMPTKRRVMQRCRTFLISFPGKVWRALQEFSHILQCAPRRRLEESL